MCVKPPPDHAVLCFEQFIRPGGNVFLNLPYSGHAVMIFNTIILVPQRMQ